MILPEVVDNPQPSIGTLGIGRRENVSMTPKMEVPGGIRQAIGFTVGYITPTRFRALEVTHHLSLSADFIIGPQADRLLRFPRRRGEPNRTEPLNRVPGNVTSRSSSLLATTLAPNCDK